MTRRQRSSSTEEAASSPGIRAALAGLPRFLLMLMRLVRDSRVPVAEKVILAAAVAYALNPLDLIPDFIPLWGRLDDLLLISLALERLLNRSGPELIREHWDGTEEEFVALTTRIGELARRLPEPIRRRLRSAVEPR